jgi:hypothetical protein
MNIWSPLLSDATLTPILVKMRGDKALKMIYAWTLRTCSWQPKEARARPARSGDHCRPKSVRIS